MNQRERILSRLQAGPVCGIELLEKRMPRYAARVLELRRDGHQIISRRCRFHFDCPSVVYELVESDQLSLTLGI